MWAHLIRQARSALAIEPAMPKQRYYPQCKQCSGRQSGAVRAARRTLVLHFGGPKAPYYAGLPPIPLSVCLCDPSSFRHTPATLTGYMLRCAC